MSQQVPPPPLEFYGKWESTEAFGNTALDWSAPLKKSTAQLVIEFTAEGNYEFKIYSSGASDSKEEITHNFKHVISSTGKYQVKPNGGETSSFQIIFESDPSGLEWNVSLEEDSTMRLRLVGAKKFARCRGVDVIYFKQLL